MLSPFIIDQETPLRLDLALKTFFPEQSRSFLQWLIEENKVSVNGKAAIKRQMVKRNDRIEVDYCERAPIEVAAEAMVLDIIFEDDDLLVLNKPQGMCVHPSIGHTSGTIVQGVMAHCEELPSDSLRPGIVHRLDKDTSGVLLIAKTDFSQQHLERAFAERRVKKEYLAICQGNPGTRTIETYIQRNPNNRLKMQAHKTSGRLAITHCTTLATHADYALVQVNIETGRTHQIRVHLSHISCPIIGDPIYGHIATNERLKVHQQLLHAHSIEITHPRTQQLLKFQAPCSPLMTHYWQRWFPIPIPLEELNFRPRKSPELESEKKPSYYH